MTRSEEHTSELQSHSDLVCRLLLEKNKSRPRRSCALSLSLSRRRRTPRSTLFPYTTLFRSRPSSRQLSARNRRRRIGYPAGISLLQRHHRTAAAFDTVPVN